MKGSPEGSILIVTHDGWDDLAACLDALRPTLPRAAGGDDPWEVIVVDNASTDATPRRIPAEYPWVNYLRLEANRGLPGGLNAGIRAARGRFLVELNNDTIPRAGWLDPLAARARTTPGVGIVSGIKENFDGTIQDAGGFYTPLRWGFRRDNPNPLRAGDVDFVATGFLMKREMLDAVGLLDEAFAPGYFEDLDLCARARAAGWRVFHEPQSRILHRGGGTMQRLNSSGAVWEIHHRNRIRFLLRHTHGLDFAWRIFSESITLLRLLLTGHAAHVRAVVARL